MNLKIQLLTLFIAIAIPLVALQPCSVAFTQTGVSETYVYVCTDSLVS